MRDNPLEDLYLKRILDHVNRSLVISGIGELTGNRPPSRFWSHWIHSGVSLRRTAPVHLLAHCFEDQGLRKKGWSSTEHCFYRSRICATTSPRCECCTRQLRSPASLTWDRCCQCCPTFYDRVMLDDIKATAASIAATRRGWESSESSLKTVHALVSKRRYSRE